VGKPTENVSRFSLYLFSQVHNHNINKSNRYFKLNVYYNDIDIQCLVTVHVLAITPCGQHLPSRPVVGTCHHAPWSALSIAPVVSACHRTPCGPLAVTPRGPLTIAPPVVRLPSRPVVRLPSHPLWSACHRAPCGPLHCAPPWSTCHRAPRGRRLPSRPVGLHLPSRPPWSACRRAPRGPLAIARRCHCALRSSKFLSHAEEHRAEREEGLCGTVWDGSAGEGPPSPPRLAAHRIY
jgi:hypothetical protein